MALNTSLADMPWLGQPADPSGSLARGVASGATIAGVRNQRAALSQRKFEFEQQQRLAQAQEERAAALFPLQQTLIRQQAEMGEAKLTDMLQTRQYEIEHQKSLNFITQQVSNDLKQKQPINALTALLDMQSQDPVIAKTPAFQRLMDNTKLSIDALVQQQKLNIELAQAQTAADRLRFTVEPEIQVRKNPITGEQVAMVRRGPTTWQPLPSTTDAQEAANKQAVTTLQKQIDIINKQRLDLDPTDKDFAEKRLQKLGEANALQRKINKINQGESLTTMEPEPTVAPTVEPKQVGGFRILRIK